MRTEISCDQKQLRSRTASTWISLYAHRDMFLQNDCCDLAPPDRLMHRKMLRFRHGDTLGSQSMRKKTWISIMINKQVHAMKNCCVRALRDLTPCAMRHLHATRLLRSHAQAHLDLSPCAKKHVPATPPNIDDFYNSKARSSFYSIHASTRPLPSREPVTRNLVTAPLLTHCRPRKRIRCWGNLPYNPVHHYFCRKLNCAPAAFGGGDAFKYFS